MAAKNTGHRDDRVDALIDEWKAERPELDAGAMAVVGRILALGRALEARAGAVLKPYDLHYTDLDVLATLRRGGRPYRRTPTQLRESVLITSGAMTACLDRLERNGLVERHPDPDDRRSSAATLTRRGLAVVDAAIEVRFREASDALRVLTAAEKRQLAALLKRLLLGIER